MLALIDMRPAMLHSRIAAFHKRACRTTKNRPRGCAPDEPTYAKLSDQAVDNFAVNTFI
jgi:hypothetical protein